MVGGKSDQTTQPSLYGNTVISFKYKYGSLVPLRPFVQGLPVTYTPYETSKDVKVSIHPLFYKHVVVQWSIPFFWGATVFNVFRSPTEYGPWTLLTPTPIDGSFFKDTSSDMVSKFNQEYYIVDAIHFDGRISRSLPFSWENTRNNFAEIRAREIQRREKLLLSKFVGVKSLVFKRKTFGKRCKYCWDERAEKVMKDNCQHCLGTSFEGGYFPPYETLFQYDPTPGNATLSYKGVEEPNLISAWTISYPRLNAFDIVIRIPDAKVYRVEALESTELQTVTVRQIVNLNELGKHSVEYAMVEKLLPKEMI